MNLRKAGFTVGWALLAGLGAAAVLHGQDSLGLGNSKDEMTFQGTGTQVINVVWQNCDSSGCTMSGGATSVNELRPVGTYKFSSPTPRPFKLLGSSALGRFSVEQAAEVRFAYASPQGTLEGQAHFTRLVQNRGHIAASLVGTLQVTGGTFAQRFASSPDNLNLSLAVGKKDLSTLVDSTASINGAIDFLSSLTPAGMCRTASNIPSTLKGAPLPGGDIWFSSTLRARGVHDGTSLQFQGGFIQFVANGNTNVLHVPNAVITFSSAAPCATARFSAETNTWETTVPVTGSKEVFLTGMAFPIPAAGIKGGIGAVNWQEAFASSAPGVTVEWKWSAAVYRQLSADYNSLGVKAAQQDACPYRNDDPAGTPEKFAESAVGGPRRGAAQGTGAWSAAVTDQANCP